VHVRYNTIFFHYLQELAKRWSNLINTAQVLFIFDKYYIISPSRLSDKGGAMSYQVAVALDETAPAEYLHGCPGCNDVIWGYSPNSDPRTIECLVEIHWCVDMVTDERRVSVELLGRGELPEILEQLVLESLVEYQFDRRLFCLKRVTYLFL
jgi:hypothetical protein